MTAIRTVEDTPAKTAVETETRKVHNNYSDAGLSLHILPSWEAQDYTSYSSEAPEDVKNRKRRLGEVPDGRNRARVDRTSISGKTCWV